MVKIFAMVVVTLASFNVATTQTHSLENLEKYVDLELRRSYYAECKDQKLKGCHMIAFEQSVRLRLKH